MPTYKAVDLTNKPLPSIDNAAIFTGTVTPGTATATGDVLQPLRISNGTRVAALLVNVRTAFGGTAPASVGVTNADGSTPNASKWPNAATQFVAATDTSHASTGSKVLLPVGGPFLTDADMTLQVAFGTVAGGAAGSADYVVLGECIGAR